VVHQRARLGSLTVLGEARRADFPYLKSLLQLTDGNLGRHIEVLAAEGLVTVTKGYQGRRPRTWVEITKLGRGALAAEMTALKQLLERYEQSPRRRPRG
jgi:DNA-binding MarR family transcriptional regulator